MSAQRYAPLIEELSMIDLAELFEAIEEELQRRNRPRLAGLVAITRHDIRASFDPSTGKEPA
jgi:hypothetical protein